MFRAGLPNATTRLCIATLVLLAAAVGATQRGSQADATTGCGSDELTVTVRIRDVVPGFWWQHTLYNVTGSSKTRGGPLVDHLAVPLPVPLAAGLYDVTVVTMDDHSGALIPDRAVSEQLVVALEGPPTLGAYTLPTQDLPDGLDRIESPVGTLTVDRDTDTVYAIHRSIPDPRAGSNRAFGNSIVPEEITFRCLAVVSPTTLVPSTTVPTTTTTVPVIPTTTTVPVAPTTTTPPSTTVPPTLLPATDGADVIAQVVQTGENVEADVPSAPAAVESQFVPTYNG